MIVVRVFAACLTPATTIHPLKAKACNDTVRPGADTSHVVAVIVLVGIVLVVVFVGAVLGALIRRTVGARRS